MLDCTRVLESKHVTVDLKKTNVCMEKNQGGGLILSYLFQIVHPGVVFLVNWCGWICHTGVNMIMGGV